MAKKIKNFTAHENQAANKNIDVIVGTILSRAQKLADRIVNDAKILAEESAAQKRANIDAYCAKIINEAKSKAEKIIEHTQMLSELESKKIVKNSLAHILDRTFLDAEKNILRLPDESYLKLLEGMIKKYAEAGDEVIVSQNESRLSVDWLNKINKKYVLSLKLSAEKGDFSGGMLLRNKVYDKNLTVNALINEMRGDIQQEVLDLVTENRRIN